MDRLGHRLQSAAARALNHPEQNQHGQTGGDSAKQRCQREKDDAQDEEALPPERSCEPSADGKNDGVRDEIGRQDPGALVITCAKVAPARCGKATLAMLVSSTSMNAASATTKAIAQGLYFGFQTSGASGIGLLVEI